MSKIEDICVRIGKMGLSDRQGGLLVCDALNTLLVLCDFYGRNPEDGGNDYVEFTEKDKETCENILRLAVIANNDKNELAALGSACSALCEQDITHSDDSAFALMNPMCFEKSMTTYDDELMHDIFDGMFDAYFVCYASSIIPMCMIMYHDDCMEKKIVTETKMFVERMSEKASLNEARRIEKIAQWYKSGEVGEKP